MKDILRAALNVWYRENDAPLCKITYTSTRTVSIHTVDIHVKIGVCHHTVYRWYNRTVDSGLYTITLDSKLYDRAITPCSQIELLILDICRELEPDGVVLYIKGNLIEDVDLISENHVKDYTTNNDGRHTL